MAYQPNIPQPTDQISQSQQDLLDNFTAISTLINVNHVDFNGPDQGKHKFLTFPVQAMAPVFAAGEIGMYNFLYTVTGVDELFITNQAGVTSPITAKEGNQTGWTFLPSGLLIKWGVVNAAAGVSNHIFPVGANIPAFTNVPYNWSFTLERTSATPPVNSVYLNSFGGTNNALQFSVYLNTASTIRYLIIGPGV